MYQRTMFWSAMFAVFFLVVLLMFGFETFGADRNACSDEIAKFCKGIKEGRPALLECLEQHEAQLSDACKDYEASLERPRMESRERAAQQLRVRQMCKDDVSKFCNNVKSPNGGIATCLNTHASELSAPCRDALKAARGGEEEKKSK